MKAQHPEFELWSQGIHARSGVACADCHMPYKREGAMKVSEHHVQSPLLMVNQSCQTCHRFPETELIARVEAIQDRTHALMSRAGTAMTDMLDAIKAAKAAGATNEQLAPASALQRKAQWRLDFVNAENSMGFHAPQEAARILGESIDYSRQAQLVSERPRRVGGRPMSTTTAPSPSGHPKHVHAKALAINLDPTTYGSFAEIGAGQEVARWFLRVGGAAGTVAQTISAYDKTFSDETYGAGTRYVSKERVVAMLDYEYGLLLQPARPDARPADAVLRLCRHRRRPQLPRRQRAARLAGHPLPGRARRRRRATC